MSKCDAPDGAGAPTSGTPEAAAAQHPAAGFVSCPEKAARACRGLAVLAFASAHAVVPGCLTADREEVEAALLQRGRARSRSVSPSQCRGRTRRSRPADSLWSLGAGPSRRTPRLAIVRATSLQMRRLPVLGSKCAPQRRKAAPSPRDPRQKRPAPRLPPHVGQTVYRAAILMADMRLFRLSAASLRRAGGTAGHSLERGAPASQDGDARPGIAVVVGVAGRDGPQAEIAFGERSIPTHSEVELTASGRHVG